MASWVIIALITSSWVRFASLDDIVLTINVLPQMCSTKHVLIVSIVVHLPPIKNRGIRSRMPREWPCMLFLLVKLLECFVEVSALFIGEGNPLAATLVSRMPLANVQLGCVVVPGYKVDFLGVASLVLAEKGNGLLDRTSDIVHCVLYLRKISVEEVKKSRE